MFHATSLELFSPLTLYPALVAHALTLSYITGTSMDYVPSSALAMLCSVLSTNTIDLSPLMVAFLHVSLVAYHFVYIPVDLLPQLYNTGFLLSLWCIFYAWQPGLGVVLAIVLDVVQSLVILFYDHILQEWMTLRKP